MQYSKILFVISFMAICTVFSMNANAEAPPIPKNLLPSNKPGCMQICDDRVRIVRNEEKICDDPAACWDVVKKRFPEECGACMLKVNPLQRP